MQYSVIPPSSTFAVIVGSPRRLHDIGSNSCSNSYRSGRKSLCRNNSPLHFGWYVPLILQVGRSQLANDVIHDAGAHANAFGAAHQTIGLGSRVGEGIHVFLQWHAVL